MLKPEGSSRSGSEKAPATPQGAEVSGSPSGAVVRGGLRTFPPQQLEGGC